MKLYHLIHVKDDIYKKGSEVSKGDIKDCTYYFDENSLTIWRSGDSKNNADLLPNSITIDGAQYNKCVIAAEDPTNLDIIKVIKNFTNGCICIWRQLDMRLSKGC